MKITFFNCQVDDLTMQGALEKIKRHVKSKKPLSHVCLNVDSVVRANRDEKYLQLINRAGLVTLDGMPLVFVSRMLGVGIKERVQGADLFTQLLKVANKLSWKVYFLGAQSDVPDDVLARIDREYPEIKIAGAHDGYWSERQEGQVIKEIAKSKSDLIFVALGAPRQDEFVDRNLKRLRVSFAIGVGGCFDIFAGRKRSAPAFVQKMGFQWLFRFFQEPRRLFKRYFIDDLYIIPLFVKELYHRFFYLGHKRSTLIKTNVAWSLVLQAASIALGFFWVPLSLKYLGKDNYGIFLTLTSLIGWLALFDFGFGQGLRNRLAEALGSGEKKLAKAYVSTAYVGLAIVFGFLFAVFFLINHFVNWSVILGMNVSGDVRNLAYYIFAASCLQFILSLINTIVTADQKPAFGRLIAFLSSILVLVGVFVITIMTLGSLFRYGLVVVTIPVLVYLVASLIFFRGKYKMLAPSLKLARFKYVRKLLNLGAQFFVINLAIIMVFQTDYLIISHIFGASQVVAYNIAFKYFGLITTAFALVVMPFWSATTEAYAKGDFEWIKNAASKLKKVFFLFFVAGVVLLAISPWFYQFWLHGVVVVPFSLSLAMFVYAQLINWGSIFVVFINGVGRIRVQFFASIIGAIINIPLSILLARNFHFGPAGIIVATTVCIFYGYIIAPIQFKKLVQGKL